MLENGARLLPRPEITFERSLLGAAVRGKRVLVTGAGGSIGSALALLLRELEPDRLVLLDSHEASLFQLRQRIATASAAPDVRYVLADLRDRAKVQQTFRRERIDVAFHLAAYKHVPFAEDNVDQVVNVNVIGTLNVVEAAAEHGASTVVYPSSDKAVTPRAVYAATKRIAERVFQAIAAERERPALRVVRLVNVFETQGNVIETFARQIQEGLPLSITDLGMDRYWMTKREATHLLLVAASRPSFEGLYLLDVGKPVRIADTARCLYRLLRDDDGEPEIHVSGIRAGERLHEQLTFPFERIRPTDLAGLLVVDTPAYAVSAQAWIDELTRFRERGYGWEPDEIKRWLLRLVEEGDAVKQGRWGSFR